MKTTTEIKNQNNSNIIFLAILFAFLLLSLMKCLFFPDKINTYENRFANKVSGFSLSSYKDGKFQNSFEGALSDQLLFSEALKKSYNMVENKTLIFVTKPLASLNKEKYVSFSNLYYYGGESLVYSPTSLTSQKDSLLRKATAINKLAEKYRDIPIFVYYIERDTDINFTNNQNTGAYGYLNQNLHLNKENIACFKVENFSDYQSYYFKTDHHWNNKGAYKGYLDIAKLLGIKNVFCPMEETCISDSFSGQKAFSCGAGSLLKEDFYAYKFALCPIDTTINGKKETYGKEEEYFSRKNNSISYGNFYGWDEGEIIFDTGNEDKGNILIFGDSFDNAILNLIAPAFHKTFSVDLRYYKAKTGKDLHLDSYIKENNISKILFVGSNIFFTSHVFDPEVNQ